MRSVELTLDSETDAAVRGIWARLAEAELPSLDSHTSESNRPHVTLAAGELLEDSPGLREALGSREAPALPIHFGGVLLFPAAKGRFVLTLGVVASPRLLEMHARAHVRLSGAVELTRPGSWTPHVTLSRRLTPDQLAAALPLIPVVAAGRVAGARLWDGEHRTTTELA